MAARRKGLGTSAQFTLPLPYLRTPEAARFIGVSPRTLEKRRIEGNGPRYSKIGGRVLYAVKDLRKYVESGAKRSTSDRCKTTVPPLSRKAQRSRKQISADAPPLVNGEPRAGEHGANNRRPSN
jgi:Helix-turn-helix domain